MGYLVLGAVLGAALTLAVQLVIQFCVVPKVETRKRREDRWERDVRELGELLTTQLAERADAANVEQSAFRFVLLQLESTADADKDKVSHLKDEHSLKARHATAAFNDLAHTRMPWLVGRVKSIDPDSAEIVKFGTMARHHRIRAISVDDWSGVYVHPDPTFDEVWDQERDARRALVEQVTALLDLPHPPRASLRRRWWRRGARRIHAGIAKASPQPLKPANEGLGAVLRDNGQALDRCGAAVQRGQQRLS